MKDFLQNLPAAIEGSALSSADQIYCLKLAIVFTDVLAQQGERALEQLQRQYPPLAQHDTSAYQLIGAPAMRLLLRQVSEAKGWRVSYHAELTRLQAANPAHAPIWQAPAEFATIQDQYTYPIGSLLQELPNEITNQHFLTKDQQRKCFTLAALAESRHMFLLETIASLGKLLATLGNDVLHSLGELINYLATEACFMHWVATDYQSAAENIRVSDG